MKFTAAPQMINTIMIAVLMGKIRDASSRLQRQREKQTPSHSGRKAFLPPTRADSKEVYTRLVTDESLSLHNRIWLH